MNIIEYAWNTQKLCMDNNEHYCIDKAPVTYLALILNMYKIEIQLRTA